MQHEFIDISHTITNEMITYKGLPAPIICDFMSREKSKENYDDGSTFQIGKIEMVGNTGTYLDCPFHRYEDGKDLSEVGLENLAGLKGVLIEAPFENGLEIGVEFFVGKNLKNKAVLICTGWSKFWRTDPYFENHPFLNATAAEYLKIQNIKLVGIDSHNIDDTGGKGRPVHSILLKNEILIVEHLTNLEKLKGKDFSFSAIPPKIENFGTFPVRAFATFKKNEI